MRLPDFSSSSIKLFFANRAEIRTSNFFKLGGNILNFARLTVKNAVRIFKVSAVSRKGIAKPFIALCFMASIECFADMPDAVTSPAANNTSNQSGSISLPVSGNPVAVKFRNQFWWFLTGLCNGLVFTSMYYNRKSKKNN